MSQPLICSLARDDLKTDQNLQKCCSCFCFTALLLETRLHTAAAVNLHLNWRAGSLLWLSLANDFKSTQRCSYFWTTIEMLASSMTGEFMHNNSLSVNRREARREVGQKSFPGLTPKCLYTYTHTQICPPFPHPPFLNLTLADGAHSILTCLNICVICAHAAMYAHVCVCFHACVMRSYIWVGPSLLARQQISPSSQD